MAAMAEVCASHFVARRSAQNARSALFTPGSARCGGVAALGLPPAQRKAAWLLLMLLPRSYVQALSRRPVAMCMCVEAQDAEAVLAAAEQWLRRVQVVHGAWRAQSAERSGMLVVAF